MKINKKQAGLIAGVVCVILLILLLLSMCNSRGGQNEPVQPVESIAPTEETVSSAQETTEATEETAEATEETTESTEATEESTEPTTGGNTRPGGTTGPGFDSGSNDDEETPAQTTPAAGSEKSPYTETVARFPDAVNTVSIPAEGVMYYNLNLEDETVETYGESLLTITAEDAYVIYNETKYEAENGIVSVPLAAVTEEDTPVTIQIYNISKEAKAFDLNLDAPLGTVDNPEQIRGENGEIAIDAALEAGDEDGYHYGFDAERDGTLILQLDSVTENVDYDIIVTTGENKMTISSGAEESSVTMDFKKGDAVTIQVIVKADEEGTIPAAQMKVSGIADYYGSKTNPIVVDKDFTTEEMEPGLVLYYLVNGQKGMALNVEDPAYVIYNDKTYQAETAEDTETPDGSEEDSGEAEDTEEEPVVVSVKIGNSDDSALMAIGNGGEEAASFAVTFGYPAGHAENKAPLVVKNVDEQEDGSNTAVVEIGDTDVYWYTWTNTVDTGILTVQMPAEGSWKYKVMHTSNEKTTEYELQYSDGESVQRTFNLVMAYDDVVDILVSTYDPADKDAFPVGSVEFEASFQAHVLTNASGDTWLTLDAGALIYCKQGLKYADGAIMTVVAVEADAEGNAILDEDGNVIVLTDRAFTIDYEGTVYTAENGTIVVEGIEMESTDPDIFSFLNESSEKTTYRISFSYPLGHQTNPIPITSGKYSVELYGDGGSGIYYSWTTSEPGTFMFEIDPSTVWTYNISSSMDTAVSSSTQNGSSTDVDPDVEITIGQSHINASKDGTVTMTINLGNPSTDPENKSVVSFEVNSYKTRVTDNTTVKVAASQTHRLMQMLADTSANGVVITGADNFTVVYDGKEHVAENGNVTITNFSADSTYFQIINNSDAEQTYSIVFTYPLGNPKNPEIIEAGTWNVDLFTITEYYYSWTAPSDGTFTFALPTSADRYKPWAYEITHGDNIYSAKRGGKTTQSFDVLAGETVSIKLGVSGTVSASVTVDLSVSFTEAAATMSLNQTDEAAQVVYEGEYVPKAFELRLAEGQELAYMDLTQKYELYLNEENGCYYLTENGPMVLVDFTSDAFVNLAKLMEDSELYCEITAEDGTVTRETYNTLLQKYIACAEAIEVSENVTRTLYPLTEDLMYILKNAGGQLGWYDSANAAYKFAEVTGAEADSLWMFSCCYVQTVEVQPAETQTIPAEQEVSTEQTVTTEQPVDTTTEGTEEEDTEETSESEPLPEESVTE